MGVTVGVFVMLLPAIALFLSDVLDWQAHQALIKASLSVLVAIYLAARDHKLISLANRALHQPKDRKTGNKDR